MTSHSNKFTLYRPVSYRIALLVRVRAARQFQGERRALLHRRGDARARHSAQSVLLFPLAFYASPLGSSLLSSRQSPRYLRHTKLYSTLQVQYMRPPRLRRASASA